MELETLTRDDGGGPVSFLRCDCVSRKLRLVRRTEVLSLLLALLHIDMCVLNILRVLLSLIAIYLF